jgi:glycosyltransferase involved in cell wall biosynthesis
MTIKILYHLNQVGYGGTEKAILSFCQNLNRDKFEPYLFIYNKNPKYKYYWYLFLSKLSKKYKNRFFTKYIHSRARLSDFVQTIGQKNIFEGNAKEFEKIINTVSPDIVHFNRGKWEPFFDDLINQVPDSRVCIETNIFGYPASEHYFKRLKKAYFVSHWLLQKSSWSGNKGAVLYNPIKKPANSESIRKTLQIPEDVFLFGRISRPDLMDDDFILEVFSKIKNENAYLLVLAGSRIMRDAAENNDRIILIDATTSESTISHFYNSIDLLLHYRIDGETFGMNIAEAMIHGKPVISHLSQIDNAQAELLESTAHHGVVGYVCPRNDMTAYLNHMLELMNNPEKLAELGNNARHRACDLFQEDIVTRYLENEYTKLLSESYVGV